MAWIENGYDLKEWNSPWRSDKQKTIMKWALAGNFSKSCRMAVVFSKSRPDIQGPLGYTIVIVAVNYSSD